MNWVPGIDSFAQPEALLLLLLIPVYLFWYYRYFQPQRLVVRLSYDPFQVSRPQFNWAWLRVLVRSLQIAALGLLILALARPQQDTEVVETETEGLNLMLALDISGSMEQQDLPPSRMEVTKALAGRFISQRRLDQIGIVLFAAEALTYAPLTPDHEYLARMLRSVQPGMLSRQGTAIGSAVGVAINRLREAEGAGKAIVLITDGANNTGDIDPVTAARLAASYSIRLYVLSIGSSGADAQGAALQEMARLTGGAWFHAEGTEAFEAAFSEIDRLEKQPLPAAPVRRVRDQYPRFIQWAMILFTVSFVLMLTPLYNPLEQ
ncbi:MAG: VWA domain-containing protein [Bacteroidia bacterium]|nr:VWA domain-containing protein [Bacteroidia bacterium]